MLLGLVCLRLLQQSSFSTVFSVLRQPVNLTLTQSYLYKAQSTFLFFFFLEGACFDRPVPR